MQPVYVAPRYDWMTTELYEMLVRTFPTMRTKKQKVLDVERLADSIGMTKEGLYKWLREGRILSKRGAERLHELANSDDNRAALQKSGNAAPSKQDIARFLLS